jgi:hypothetical protein
MYYADWNYEANNGKKVKCPECSRVFDPRDENDAEELAYGHDCEA